ncbi:diguanylate cyclase [Aquabacterium fontiphilum]|uniref:GGDEF domain-containing protein n=1 Tax=Aquabacterium fontiphilum TaxID=450365 RepID=UPI0013774F28|nr:GGDEF domain-containing protein [Aquabacterium fontiphilum]NBD19256.1 diguanylate cyclase [Aquabacterium fontiphilum]
MSEQSVASGAFARLLLSGALLGGVVHIAFALLFYQGGAITMAWVNVGSVLVYVVAGRMLAAGHVGWALATMAIEIVAHAVLAVRMVGWDSGFHFYLLITIPVLLASGIMRWPAKIGSATLIASIYVAMDWYWRRAMPLHPLDADTLRHLHQFNLVSTITVLGGLTVVYVQLIRDAEKRLHRMATTDHLTGLMNRRSLVDALEREQARRLRKPHPMTVILVDIDHFKQLNDTYGHAVGDWALQAVAGVLKKGVREMDFVARWGGEEFLIVLPFADGTQANPVAERLRETIRTIEHPGRLPLQLGATLGVAEVGTEEDVEQAIQRADAALYQGKHQGRNRVVIAEAALV